MRFLPILLVLLLSSPAQAESKYFKGYRFNAYVESYAHPMPTSSRGWLWKKNVLNVHEGQEYSIVVHNPLPVRVGAAVSVDGLNTIDGHDKSPANSTKWIIPPYSSITVRGWQTDDNSLRKFVFTRPENSYATWREQTEGRNYTRKHGEIEISYFWDSHELRHALRRQHRYDLMEEGNSPSALGKSERRSKSGIYQDKAGTGMGRRERNSVHTVGFHFDTGMYASRDAIKIYYKFYSPEPHPHHYHDYSLRYRNQHYAPEMPY